MPIQGSPIGAIHQHASVEGELEAVLDLLETRITAASKPVVLPTITLKRFGLLKAFERFLNASGLAYATTPMDKGLLSEEHPAFLGMYNGARSTPAALRGVVEDADLVVDFGGLVLEDLNTGLWSGSLDPKTIISLHADWVQAGHQVFTSVSIGDVLIGLTKRLEQSSTRRSLSNADRLVCPDPILPLQGEQHQPTDSSSFYPRLQRFLRPNDVLVSDTGTCLLKLNAIRLPSGVDMESQTLWSSIGWGTPAALGCALADPERRVVLVTGDGAHQLTVQEVGVMGFMQIKAVVIVLNNGLYGVEALISETGHAYNVLPPWRYADIPAALGCQGWWCGRATTVAELEQSLAAINAHQGAAYLEVMIPAEESQPLAEEVIETMHRQQHLMLHCLQHRMAMRAPSEQAPSSHPGLHQSNSSKLLRLRYCQHKGREYKKRETIKIKRLLQKPSLNPDRNLRQIRKGSLEPGSSLLRTNAFRESSLSKTNRLSSSG